MGAKRVGDKVQIGLVDRQPGTGWLVERLLELIEELRPERIVCDERGPAASLLDELEEAGIEVETIGTVEYTRACGMFFDAVEQGTIVHDGDPALEAAVRGAAQRTLADAWAWSRKHSRSDITPLVAATIAYRAEATQEKKSFIAVGFA
jgi:phage terminase large subunit-like protein